MASQFLYEKTNGRSKDHPGSVSEPRLQTDRTFEKPDPIQELRQSLKQVADAVTEFGQARVDRIKVSARNMALNVALGVVGGLAGVIFLVVSMVLLLTGLSGAVARVMNAPPWAGYLIVGAVCVGGPLTVLLIQIKRIRKKWLQQLRDKYAGRTETQCQ